MILKISYKLNEVINFNFFLRMLLFLVFQQIGVREDLAVDENVFDRD